LVQKRLFTEGSDVKTGDVLYQIDPAPFQAAVDSAAANLDVVRRTADEAPAALAASLARLAAQKATLDLAKINRQRFEDLLKDKAVSTSDCDQAVANADVAEATLAAARAQVDSDRQAIAAAQAAIKQAQAALETVRINLAYTRITAPISGRIGKSTVTDGAIVTAYQPTPLATIQQLERFAPLRSVPAMRDESLGVGRGHGRQRLGNPLEQSRHRPPGQLPQNGFDLRDRIFDRIEIGRIRRQSQHPAPGRLD
jgi:membrane fusion protein (multidrug efflux system)